MKKLLAAVVLVLAGLAVPVLAQTTTTNATTVALGPANGYTYNPVDADAKYDDGSVVIVDRISPGNTNAQVKLAGETSFTSLHIPDPTVTQSVVNGYNFYYVVVADFTLRTQSGKTFTLVGMNWTSERKAGWRGGWTYTLIGGACIYSVD